MQHWSSSTTETATTGMEPVIALILRSGMTKPGMVDYVMDNLMQAMQYVMECSPDRKSEVLKYSIEAMKPDAVDPVSSDQHDVSWTTTESCTDVPDIHANRRLRLWSKVMITADIDKSGSVMLFAPALYLQYVQDLG